MIERITILDFQDTPPTVVAHVWYSPERGITCDDAWTREYLRTTPPVVAVRDGVWPLTPAHGRVYFEALLHHFGGLVRAQPIEVVQEQGGEAV